MPETHWTHGVDDTRARTFMEGVRAVLRHPGLRDELAALLLDLTSPMQFGLFKPAPPVDEKAHDEIRALLAKMKLGDVRIMPAPRVEVLPMGSYLVTLIEQLSDEDKQRLLETLGPALIEWLGDMDQEELAERLGPVLAEWLADQPKPFLTRTRKREDYAENELRVSEISG